MSATARQAQDQPGLAERLGIKIDPPSINRSHVDFEVDGNTIIYALAALKGVGKGEFAQT